MSIQNSNLKGAGTVFRYTVQQHYKNKAVLIFLTVLFVLALAAFPLLKLQFGKESVDTGTIKTLYFCNQTNFSISSADITASEDYAELHVKEADYDEKALSELLNTEEAAAATVLKLDETRRLFTIRTYYGENSTIGNSEANELNSYLEKTLHTAVMHAMQITQEQEDMLNCQAYAQVARAADYAAGSEESSTDTHVMVNMIYCYLIMMLCALSMGYIFQLCMEEKMSKLVESLLVSVSPTALMIGKVLSVTLFIFCGLGLVAFGLIVSYFMSGISGNLTEVLEMAGNAAGFNISGLHLTVGSAILLIVCVLLAYFTFAFLSGTVGSCCSKTEDSQQASIVVVMIMMLGYFSGMISPMFENDAANYALALLPFTSVFTALPNYLCGKIGLPVFVLALILQAVVAALLARLAGSVYKMMLLYRGGVPTPKQLYNMLRAEKAAGKARAGKES